MDEFGKESAEFREELKKRVDTAAAKAKEAWKKKKESVGADNTVGGEA
jgi:hypothetical protein